MCLYPKLTLIKMDIDALIAKYLNGACSAGEINERELWRGSASQNEKLFRRSEEVWRLAKADPLRNTSDKRAVWDKISQYISGRYSKITVIRVAGIAATIALFAGFALSYLVWYGKLHPQNRQIVMHVPGGVRSQITLPDGTLIWLNSSSTLRYPLFFDGSKREIELVGEAFLDVVPHPEQPFIIRSNEIQVKVLGTSFNFKHYAEDSHAVLAVETGKVTLSRGPSDPVTVTANQYATVNNETGQMNVFEASSNHFSSWRDNKIVFRNEPFGNVLNELSRKYNVHFEIRNDVIKTYTYTATFEDLTLEDIMELLKMSSPIDYITETLTLNQHHAYEKRKIMIFQK